MDHLTKLSGITILLFSKEPTRDLNSPDLRSNVLYTGYSKSLSFNSKNFAVLTSALGQYENSGYPSAMSALPLIADELPVTF